MLPIVLPMAISASTPLRTISNVLVARNWRNSTELPAELVDRPEDHDARVEGHVEGGGEDVEHRRADPLEALDDQPGDLVAGLDDLDEQLADRLERRLEGRGQMGDGVGGPVDDVPQGVDERLADLADRVDDGIDGIDDGVGDVLDDVDDGFVIGSVDRRRDAGLVDLLADIAKPEQDVAHARLVVLAVWLGDEVVHDHARLGTGQLADGVDDTAALTLEAIGLDQGAALVLGEARRPLEQLALVGEVEVLGVGPAEVDGLRRAHRERVLQRTGQLDRAVLDLAELRLELEAILQRSRDGDLGDPVHGCPRGVREL